MSTNKYNATTGQLTSIADSNRIWVGTTAAHDAAVQAGTMPNNCMVYVTDDSSNELSTTPTQGSTLPITSGGVYNALFVNNFTYNVDTSIRPQIQFYGVVSSTGTGTFRRLKINDKISILTCSGIGTVSGTTQAGEARCTLFFPKTEGKSYNLISFFARQYEQSKAYVGYKEFLQMTNDWRVDFYMEDCVVNKGIIAGLTVIEYS